ncbi:MAG: hypothetical protein HUU35_03080 [Armatimonadetes bacterium]|nr:hypothetical protein [Armatimonadota bacterium]
MVPVLKAWSGKFPRPRLSIPLPPSPSSMQRPPRSLANFFSSRGHTMNAEQKKANLKTGLILTSVALVFFVGFVVKMAVLGK